MTELELNIKQQEFIKILQETLKHMHQALSEATNKRTRQKNADHIAKLQVSHFMHRIKSGNGMRKVFSQRNIFSFPQHIIERMLHAVLTLVSNIFYGRTFENIRKEP